MKASAPSLPQSSLKLVHELASVVMLLSALAVSAAAVLHLAAGFSRLAIVLVLWQWLPLLVLGGLLRTHRNLKRSLPVRRACAGTFWVSSFFWLIFYGAFALLDTSNMSIAHPHPGLIFLVAPLWALGIMGVVWLWLWGLEQIWRYLEKKQPRGEETASAYAGPRCVSCQQPIAAGVDLCPKCGWTQPR